MLPSSRHRLDQPTVPTLLAVQPTTQLESPTEPTLRPVVRVAAPEVPPGERSGRHSLRAIVAARRPGTPTVSLRAVRR